MMQDSLFSLQGRVALVTGAGSGIGQHIAKAFAQRGASLVLVGRRMELLKQTLAEHHGHCIAVDLAEHDAIQDIANQCKQSSLMPDILVHAAGVSVRVHADQLSYEDWRYTMALNTDAPFFLTQVFVPHMRQQKWGRIITIASLQSFRAFPNGAAYGSSKGAIAQMTRAMAEAWSKDGINANALVPGFFSTPLTAPVFADDARRLSNANQTAIGRNGELDDLVGPAVFLASEASHYVTGHLLAVDGGFLAK